MRDGTPVGEVGGKLAPLRHCSTDDGGGGRAEYEAKEPAGVVDGGDVDQAEKPECTFLSLRRYCPGQVTYLVSNPMREFPSLLAIM